MGTHLPLHQTQPDRPDNGVGMALPAVPAVLDSFKAL